MPHIEGNKIKVSMTALFLVEEHLVECLILLTTFASRHESQSKLSYSGKTHLLMTMSRTTHSSFKCMSKQLQCRRFAMLGAHRTFATSVRGLREPTKEASDPKTKTTDFGFETVAESLKASRGAS